MPNFGQIISLNWEFAKCSGYRLCTNSLFPLFRPSKKCSACFWPNFSEIDHMRNEGSYHNDALVYLCGHCSLYAFYSCSLNEMTCLDASTQICLRSKTYPSPLQITTSPRRCFCNNNNALKGIHKTRPCWPSSTPQRIFVSFLSIHTQSTLNKGLNWKLPLFSFKHIFCQILLVFWQRNGFFQVWLESVKLSGYTLACCSRTVTKTSIQIYAGVKQTKSLF